MFSRRRAPLGVIGFVIAMPLMADSCANAGGTPAGGSGSGSNASAKASTPVAINTPMKASNGETVTVTAFGPAPAQADGQTAAAGKECDQVSLSFTNGSSSEWLDPPSEIGVVDAGGQKYTIPAIDCGVGDNISSVVAGGHATANEIFEVPTGSALNVSWVPNMLSSELYQTKLR